jgi:uncharacterized protein YodC (DUF2158 family)
MNVGDIVKLKSGGPSMTVDAIGPDLDNGDETVAFCQWFGSSIGPAGLYSDTFNVKTLTIQEKQ